MKNELSKLLKKKTNAFFKISLFLFVFSFALLSVSSVLLYSRYEQLNADFIKNSNTHLIEISSLSESSTIVNPLTFDDIQSVKKINADISGSAYVFTDYAINFGITSSLNDTFFVKSVDDTADFVEKIADFEAIANQSFKEQKMILHIPKIDVKDAGFSSSSMSDMEILIKPTTTNQIPISDVSFHSDILYVNTATFMKIIEKMYMLQWDDFVERYSSGEIFGINIVNKIYVYVDKLKDVKPVAAALNQAGYNTNYILSGFNDLSSSINSNIFIFLIIGAFILLVTTVNIIIAFRNYFLLSKKDIGTLKFYGYENSRIYKAYATNMKKILYTVQLAGAIIAVAFSIAFIKSNLVVFIVNLILIQFLFLLVIKLCAAKQLKQIIMLDTLDLIQK